MCPVYACVYAARPDALCVIRLAAEWKQAPTMNRMTAKSQYTLRLRSGQAFRLALTVLMAATALALSLPFTYADELTSWPPALHSYRQPSASAPLTLVDYRDILPHPRPPLLTAMVPSSAAGPGVRLLLVSGTQAPLNDPAVLYKIDPTLRKRLLIVTPDERIPIVIEMRQQADLDALPAGTAAANRAGAVVDMLRATALQSQAGIRSFLASQVIAGRASEVRPFWIFNGLAAHVAAEDVAALAAREDVGLIREDRYRQWVDWTPNPAERGASSRPTPQGGAPAAAQQSVNSSVEWGIAKIRAGEVWNALNISGTGVVVAHTDTGVDWQHPALQAAYRGYAKGMTSHVGNWYDATGEGAVYPIDPHGHGTHTMGSIVGGEGIGVAPGARWIAVRVLNAAGFGYDSWIHAGFEWALAPNGDPSLAPHVLSNSWGNPVPGDTTFQNDLRALRSAGIFAVFSSGNGGPDASSVGSPASLPEAFAVGATDVEDEIAAFSSRGPSPWGEVRPHVAAPGVLVRSSIPGGGYAEASGTSMAAPYVAGTIALMRSANPSLAIGHATFVLTSTAVPLSATIPNNDSGYGRIDAYAAVQVVASAGAIGGSVARSDTGAPIAGATVAAVSIGGSAGSATTDANGLYRRGLAASTYTVTASVFGYVTATQAPVFVITGTTTPLNFALMPLPSGSLHGSLADAESGQPISGTIVVVNTPVTTSANNTYSVTLPGGTFELRAIAAGHRVLTASVTITPGQIVTRDFALPPAPSILLVDSGPWYYGSQIEYYRAALDELGYPYTEHRVKHLPADVPLSTTLAAYDVVVWSAPLDAPGYIGAGGAISVYLSSGGSLFLSGQDVGFWDGGLSFNWSAYYTDRLKALAREDDSGSRALTGAGAFAGVNVSIEGSDGADNQAYPDAIGSADPDTTADAFHYANGQLGGQTIGLCLPYRAAYLAFGFEAIQGAAARREVMSRTLGYFAAPRNTMGMTLAASDDVLIAPAGSVVTQAIRLRNLAEVGGGDTFTLTAQSSDRGWSVSLSDTSVTLDSCSAATITATVSIPAGTLVDVPQSFTITARSTLSPALTVSDAFVAKSPAIALLVDDDRWYDVETAYQSALIANGISFDRWDVPKNWAGPEPGTPSPERLGWYPFVIWFTGYDWFQPLTASNEATLTQYLDRGGRALISSQFHLGWSEVSDFSRTRLGVLDAALVTTTLARSPSAPLTSCPPLCGGGAPGGAGVPSSPFDGLGTMVLSYTFPNWSEAAAPYPTATIALVGSHGWPIALTREDGAGKAMFLSFPFEALGEADRPAVMERAIGYLSWLGGSTVRPDKTVAAPGSDVTIEIVARNDGATTLPLAAFTATLPAGVSLQSGSTAWSGLLRARQAVTFTFTASLDGGLPPGGVVTIPVAFAEGAHGITFHKEARIGIARPDLSGSAIAVVANPAHSSGVVTWTLVARNTGLSDAPSATITGLLPIGMEMISATLASSVGSATELSGTVQWHGAIPAGERVTITYQMAVTRTLADRLFFGSALFDDGVALNHAKAWLALQPYRFYLPEIHKSPSYFP